MKTVDERLCDIGNVIDKAAFEQDYLDRVALEAMKEFIRGATSWDLGDAEFVEGFCSETAGASHAMARAMLKARSQGGAV